MILVNVRRTGGVAATSDQLRSAAAGDWANISDASLERFADYLAAVRQNVVVGVWAIDGHARIDDGRVRFELVDCPPFQHMIGEPSPTTWKRGQANPVKLIDTATMAPEAAEVELTPHGNRRVTLDGWSLVVYEDGRARLQAPDRDHRLMIESAFPGPKGGNVTVRLVA